MRIGSYANASRGETKKLRRSIEKIKGGRDGENQKANK